MNNLLLKDLMPNLRRGFKLIRMLNFDYNAQIGAIRVDIAVTSACSYQCCFCISHSYLKETGVEPVFMSDEMISNLFSSCKRLHVKELLFSGNGEPMLSKALANNIKRNGKYFKIELLTNGSTLNMVDEDLLHNLTFLTISINSGNGVSHPITHGYKGENQFQKITKHIERILNLPDAHKKLKLNYVITADNYNEVDDFLKLAISWNVGFMARPVSVDFKELETKGLSPQMLCELNEKVSGYAANRKISPGLRLSFQLASDASQMASHNQEKSRTLYPCYYGFIQSYIGSNGNVLLCSEGQEKPLGNLNNDNLESIWQKKENIALRLKATQMHKTNEPIFNSCYDCPNVQYHSLAFHNIYRRIPVLAKMLEWHIGNHC
jgi:MoaA/NifB/PqqE/SkfB family radical SAM enzyme